MRLTNDNDKKRFGVAGRLANDRETVPESLNGQKTDQNTGAKQIKRLAHNR